MHDVFSWLHLSDIHIRLPGNGVGGLALESLAAALERGDLPVRVDAILLTGDAAFGAASAEYKVLLPSLDRVARAVGLTLKDIFAVPGNHDIPRVAPGTVVHEIVDALRRGAVRIDDALENPAQRAVLGKRMASFRRFAAKLAPVWNAPPPLSHIAWRHQTASCVRLIGLNTALLANDSLDGKQLQLGETQIQYAFGDLAANDTVIVLSHHPFSWLADEERIGPWVEKLAHVHLSGHVHAHGVKHMQTGVGLELVNVSAGAAFSAADTAERFAFSFGSVRIDEFGRRELRVWPWAWSPAKMSFEPDASSLPRNAGSAHVEIALRASTPSRSPPHSSQPALGHSSRFRSPLAVYVVWHPRFSEGGALAGEIYRLLRGEPLAPLSRKLGIPVYFRSAPAAAGSALPLDIPFGEADETVIVALADETMLADADEGGWRTYLQSLADRSKAGRFIGFAWSPRTNAIVRGHQTSWSLLYKQSDGTDEPKLSARRRQLARRLQHSLAGVLIGGDGADRRKVTIFLSHATADAGALALEMRRLLGGNWPFEVFFDKLDIPVGHDFAKVIANAIRPAEQKGAVVLVAMLSDVYSSRDWCQREVLLAKRAGCPMLVVQMLIDGEDRSFPYVGNLPTVVWARLGRSQPERVAALAESVFKLVIRNKYMERQLSALCRLYGVRQPRVLTRPPELLDFCALPRDREVIVYPDPPITEAERALLPSAVQILTPTQLALMSEQ